MFISSEFRMDDGKVHLTYNFYREHTLLKNTFNSSWTRSENDFNEFISFPLSL